MMKDHKTKPPYYAVIFTSRHTNKGYSDYAVMAEKMEALAKEQIGFLAFESARSDLGITISYWDSLESIANWKANMDHLEAQRLGREKWYDYYKVRICLVEREYSFEAATPK